VELPQLTSTKTLVTKPDLETTKTKTVDGNGTVIVDTVSTTDTNRTETSTEITKWTTLGAKFTAGLTWDLTPKAAFDVGLKAAGFVGGNNTVESFWASTMTSSLDLQFTIKF
jgi:hypothetical protein